MQPIERLFDEQEQQLNLPTICVDYDDLPGGEIPAIGEQDELTLADDETDDTPGSTVLPVLPLVALYLLVVDVEQPGNSSGQLDRQVFEDFIGDRTGGANHEKSTRGGDVQQ